MGKEVKGEVIQKRQERQGRRERRGENKTNLKETKIAHCGSVE